MNIDLSNKIQRFLVQTYVNRICNYESIVELDWDVHKLIHTYQVVQMAQNLIDKTKGKLSQKLKKQIINAAVLHDIGRCYEFKNGQHLSGVDHGKMGANLIAKNFPKLKTEEQTTAFHNKLPTAEDPKSCSLVLAYVRDADMLANLDYIITHFDVYIAHILPLHSENLCEKNMDTEIIQAVKEKRPIIRKNLKKDTLLSLSMTELCWYFNLQTEAGKELAKEQKLFIKYRNCLCEKFIPLLKITKKEQEELSAQIKDLFPDASLL